MAGIILGQKQSQKQSFSSDGKRQPVTLINTSPCYLVGFKLTSEHGYFSARLGLGQIKNIKKPVQGELTKAGIKTPLRFLKEFRLEKIKDSIKPVEESGKKGLVFGEIKVFVGDEVKPTVFFKVGDKVSVSGRSKGKGFQGVVKRYHFAGGPRTHGQSHSERAPGSIGQTTTPGRVYKGKRMAGRMGGERVTIRNLEVVEVTDKSISVKGLVPGGRNGLLEIKNLN